MKYKIGSRYMYRDFSGQTFTVILYKKFLCFGLMNWTKGTRWAYPDPYEYETVTKWRPLWRIIQ